MRTKMIFVAAIMISSQAFASLGITLDRTIEMLATASDNRHDSVQVKTKFLSEVEGETELDQKNVLELTASLKDGNKVYEKKTYIVVIEGREVKSIQFMGSVDVR